MKKHSKSSKIAETTAKRGRPEADKMEKRDLKPPARISRTELLMIQASARKAGMDVSPWIRSRLGLPSTGYGKGAT